MAEPIIAIDKLRVIYNQGKSNEIRALEETTLSIYPDEYVIIHGPSGCGKSTLLHAISGLQTPTFGEVRIHGKSLNTMSQAEMVELHQKGVGMIFQAFYLIDSLTVLDNVCLPKVFVGEGLEARRLAGLRLLQRFGINEQADKFPSQLSGGQKQRVAIARALANDPEIILADEPVGNLDSENAEIVLNILRDLHNIDKKTIILVTHNAEHLIYGDRVIQMKDGRIIREEQNLPTTQPVTLKKPLERKFRVLEPNQPPELLPTPDATPPPAPMTVPVMSERKLRRTDDDPTSSNEFKLLASSFKNLLPEQVDMLLVPFKAKQLLAHLLSELNEEQITAAEGFLKELLFRNIDSQVFAERLDLDFEQGGAGWNKIRARSFAERSPTKQ